MLFLTLNLNWNLEIYIIKKQYVFLINIILLWLIQGQKQDMSAWFNLFADLDPLSNPDAIGKNEGDMDAAL